LAINIVHAVQDGDRFWGVVVPRGIAGLPTRFASTAGLIAGGEAEWRTASSRAPDVRMADVTLLSPAVDGVRESAAEASILSQARRSHDAHDQEPR
jgi:hypothetical protein